MTTLSDMIVESARVATKNHAQYPETTDLAHTFVAALHGTMQGHLEIGEGGEELQAAFNAVDRLFSELQAALETP